MVERFGLGFAPPEWDRLSRLATQKGYRAQELVERRPGQPRPARADRRLPRPPDVPADRRARPRARLRRPRDAGRGGREVHQLARDGAPSRRASCCTGCTRPGPRSGAAGRAIVVEGYTDVIQLHAAGFDNAVAAMGTSLTEEQLRELKRLCGELVLAFDADAAGQDAALRGLRLAETSASSTCAWCRCRPARTPRIWRCWARTPSRPRSPGRGACWSSSSIACWRASGQDDPDAVYRAAREVLARAPRSRSCARSRCAASRAPCGSTRG